MSILQRSAAVLKYMLAGNSADVATQLAEKDARIAALRREVTTMRHEAMIQDQIRDNFTTAGIPAQLHVVEPPPKQ